MDGFLSIRCICGYYYSDSDPALTTAFPLRDFYGNGCKNCRKEKNACGHNGPLHCDDCCDHDSCHSSDGSECDHDGCHENCHSDDGSCHEECLPYDHESPCAACEDGEDYIHVSCITEYMKKQVEEERREAG